MSMVLQAQAKKFSRPFPEVRSGYTVRVHQKVVEGEKERVQIFEGLVIAVHKGRCITDGSFTVRKIVEGVGVEKVFPMCSPNVTKVEVIKVAKVRRAKLFFLRGRRGKAARLSERFTTADEFKVAVAEQKVEEPEETEEVEEVEAQESDDSKESEETQKSKDSK
ncbi:50S ribosomal protein L19 [Candidatus Peribacteria bacterium]|jgi:large subunit ribosomal protein L19|nr:50S ribosomal protein L19 [Candidatus Peribacteria bacterium]MBT4021301.1 50S ribosomal protein L19 [Candidatus Peribacteria bacterium]MBT4241238.1 50S ribosomal protein L19 [Candidatus Peribacteria bacterium]MBT4474263.1 50S ribosomal protein L19 [Candidatus Peribacteria bacterium]